MEQLLKHIENRDNYATITGYIRNSFQSVLSNGYDNHYSYSNNSVTYLVTPHVYISTGSSFDRFGSNYTGGYCVTLYCISTNQSITLYHEDVTKTQDTVDRSMCTYSDEHGYNADDILTIVKTNETMPITDFSSVKELNRDLVLPVWKSLSLEDRMNSTVLETMMSCVYDAVQEELWELHDYIALSPTGGEDISHVP